MPAFPMLDVLDKRFTAPRPEEFAVYETGSRNRIESQAGRRIRFETLERRELLTSVGTVPVLHILAEIGPDPSDDFHPDHNLDMYQSLLDGSGSLDDPVSYGAINFSDTAAEGHFGGDSPFPRVPRTIS